MMAETFILEIKNLSLSIVDERNQEHLVLDRVSMEVPQGKITCLVGESGSGKSMTIASVLGVSPKMAYCAEGSSITFSGDTIYAIFQDPMNSLNQSVKVGKQLYQMALGYHDMTTEEFYHKMIEILLSLRFIHPELVLNQYPFELSGGMLQRLMIGCGILIEPSLMIADEPTTALDVTVQKDILRILREINESMNISILVVTHDFGVVAEIADEVIVMQKGVIVEKGEVFEIFDHPKKEYTKRLIQATFKEVGHRATER